MKTQTSPGCVRICTPPTYCNPPQTEGGEKCGLGDEVLLWVKTQLHQKQHEQQAYRVCLGLLNLSRQYPPARLNKACAIANQNQLYRLKQIKSILQSNQDQLVNESQEQLTLLPQSHENIRGPKSFH